jgi:hypothetical protein
MKAVRLSAIAVFATAATLSASPARAQTVTLDEGTFRLLIGGREVGTETFSIRQNGSGADAVIIARGRVVLDSDPGARQLTSSLQLAGGTLRPAAYDVKLEGADARQIAGRVAGGRFSARIVSSAGENMREYLVSDGAVVVDEGIAHHYYFLARRLGSDASASIPVVIPQDSRQVVAQVSSGPSESVRVGGGSVEGRRLTVGVGGNERTVWVDDQGRVLRLEMAGDRLVAERTAPPGN